MRRWVSTRRGTLGTFEDLAFMKEFCSKTQNLAFVISLLHVVTFLWGISLWPPGIDPEGQVKEAKWGRDR